MLRRRMELLIRRVTERNGDCAEITGGSDIHNVNLIGGGMAFLRKLKNINDFVSVIKGAGADDYRVTDGTRVWDACGGRL